VSFVGALIGQLALSALIRRTGKVSIAIFILATLEVRVFPSNILFLTLFLGYKLVYTFGVGDKTDGG
jgi:hypothetical protein